MIDREGELTVKCQAELLELSRSSVYYRPRPVSQRDLLLMRRLDELHLEAPFYGARKLAAQLRREGHECVFRGRKASDSRHVGPWFHTMSVQCA